MKVLFIGNSYTYYNDMPEIFKAMSESAGIPCEVKALTRGGAWLWQYEREDDEVGMQIRETVKKGTGNLGETASPRLRLKLQ